MCAIALSPVPPFPMALSYVTETGFPSYFHLGRHIFLNILSVHVEMKKDIVWFRKLYFEDKNQLLSVNNNVNNIFESQEEV